MAEYNSNQLFEFYTKGIPLIIRLYVKDRRTKYSEIKVIKHPLNKDAFFFHRNPIFFSLLSYDFSSICTSSTTSFPSDLLHFHQIKLNYSGYQMKNRMGGACSTQAGRCDASRAQTGQLTAGGYLKYLGIDGRNILI